MTNMYNLVEQMMEDEQPDPWCQAWPYLQRHMRWHGFKRTEPEWQEGLSTGDMTLAQWLDWKACIDGLVLLPDQSVDAYQWKCSKGSGRLFTVRTSTSRGYFPSEWDKLRSNHLQPEWWIKGYVDIARNLTALGVVRTRHLVDVIQSGRARELFNEDGTYWVVEWVAVPEPEMLLEIAGGTVAKISLR